MCCLPFGEGALSDRTTGTRNTTRQISKNTTDKQYVSGSWLNRFLVRPALMWKSLSIDIFLW